MKKQVCKVIPGGIHSEKTGFKDEINQEKRPVISIFGRVEQSALK
jgi:hypothetical protein